MWCGVRTTMGPRWSLGEGQRRLRKAAQGRLRHKSPQIERSRISIEFPDWAIRELPEMIGKPRQAQTSLARRFRSD